MNEGVVGKLHWEACNDCSNAVIGGCKKESELTFSFCFMGGDVKCNCYEKEEETK